MKAFCISVQKRYNVGVNVFRKPDIPVTDKELRFATLTDENIIDILKSRRKRHDIG